MDEFKLIEKEECWAELLKMWLKSIEAKIIETDDGDSGLFIYNTIKYKWSFWTPNGTLVIDIARDGEFWADVDLEVEHIDIQDPSFDPSIFFEPLKEWLDENT